MTQSSYHTSYPPEAETPLDLRVRHHAAIARKLQAQAVGESLANLGRSLASAVQRSAEWFARRRLEAQTREALMDCCDRTLADIGIPRQYIHLAAKGVDVSDPMAISEAGWRPRLVDALERLSTRRAERQRTYRELMAYSDRELEEIGLRRVDIPTIIRAA
jgi:uncharacterized protein YjiS (DUF1127 family)